MQEKWRSTEDGLNLLDAVMRMREGASPTKARKWIKTGLVTVNGNSVTIPSASIKIGAEVCIHSDKPASASKELKPPYEIFFEDKHLCIFEKPDGVPALKSGPKISSASDRMTRYLRGKYGDEVFQLLNRLDKRESGLMVMTIGLKSMRAVEEYREEVELRSYALVEGVPEQKSGVWKHRLLPNSIGLLKQVRSEKGRECTAEFEIMNAGSGYALLKLTPDQGFKGQLRAQCSIAGYPIAGDKRYGSKSNPLHRTCLHLFSIKMKHPMKDEVVEVKTRVPREFLQVVKSR